MISMQTFETVFERKINSTRESVWLAWADTTKWSAWVLMNMSNDFRVDGRYDNGNGEGGKYLEIIPFKSIQFTLEMKRYKPGSIITVSFESPDENSTVCRLNHTNLQTESDKTDSEHGRIFFSIGRNVTYGNR